MSAYTLIESRDPVDSRGPDRTLELGRTLAAAGHDVTLFLVQNGVGAARRGGPCPSLSETARVGVRICADAFALRERGITPGALAEEVESCELDRLLDDLAAGKRMLWH